MAGMRSTLGAEASRQLRGRSTQEGGSSLGRFLPLADPPPSRPSPSAFSEQSFLHMVAPDQSTKLTPRTPPVVRRRTNFGSILSQDGTEFYIACDRNNRRRATLAPALSLSLGDFRTTKFNAFISSPSLLDEPPPADDQTAIFRRPQRYDTEGVKYQMVQLAGDSRGRVQVETLGDHGFTTEDLSRVIYDKFKDEDLPDFLDHIGLEKKGGLDRISEIWYPEKYMWFFVLIGSVLFNVSYLIAMDWTICRSFALDTIDWLEGVALTNVTQTYSRLVESNQQTMDIFEHIKDPSTRWILLNVAAFIAMWEICWIVMKLFHAFYIWWLFCKGRSEYKSFHAVVYFFQKLLPQFSTFSAIKLMSKVHPSLIYNEYLYFINETSLRSTWLGLIVASCYFFLKCAMCAVAALGAFTIKLLAVSLKVMNPTYSVLYRLGNVVALMNQCMGCILMEVVLQDRIFLFVFGGQDAMYQDQEHAYKNVYECRMAKQIWQDFWDQGRRLQAIVLFATFDHYDLQKLLIKLTPEDANNVELRGVPNINGFELVPIDEVSPERERSSGETDFGISRMHGSLGPSVETPANSCSSLLGAEARRGRDWPEEAEHEAAHAVAQEALHTPEEPWPEALPREGSADGAAESASQVSRSSVGSTGMRAVTRCLQHETNWRDSA